MNQVLGESDAGGIRCWVNQVLDESGWTLQSCVLSSSTFKALRTVVRARFSSKQRLTGKDL